MSQETIDNTYGDEQEIARKQFGERFPAMTLAVFQLLPSLCYMTSFQIYLPGMHSQLAGEDEEGKRGMSAVKKALIAAGIFYLIVWFFPAIYFATQID